MSRSGKVGSDALFRSAIRPVQAKVPRRARKSSPACATVRASMTDEVTAGFVRVHAGAIWDSVAPVRQATSARLRSLGRRSPSRDRTRRPRPCGSPTHWDCATERRWCSCICRKAKPPSSGDQGRTPKPSSTAIGMNSCSTVRSTKLYLVCGATEGDHPQSSASVCIYAIRQTAVLQMPT